MFHQYLLPQHGYTGEPMNCIIQPMNGVGGLFLGNIESASNGKLLGNHEIGAILSVMSTKDYSYDSHIAHKFVRVDDADFVNLSKHFDECIEFIDSSRKQTNVLVHCHAGISRSATVVIAYLMATKNLSLNQAFQMVLKERRIINPNPGFMRQLKQYESQCGNQYYSSAQKSYQRHNGSTHNLSPQNTMRQSQFVDRNQEMYYQQQPQKNYSSFQDLLRQSTTNFDRMNYRQMNRQHPYIPQYSSPYLRNYSAPYQNALTFSPYRQPIY